MIWASGSSQITKFFSHSYPHGINVRVGCRSLLPLSVIAEPHSSEVDQKMRHTAGKRLRHPTLTFTPSFRKIPNSSKKTTPGTTDWTKVWRNRVVSLA